MKRSLLSFTLLLTATFFLSSCKKGGDDPDYYFKVKIDGNWVTYEGAYCELGPDLADPSLIDFVVNGGNDDVLVSVALQSTGNITTGTYNTAAVSPPYYMLVDYWKISASNIQVFDATPSGTGPDPYYTLNITSITSTEIRGTISGNYLYNYTDQETISLTEGEFVAQRID